MISYGPRLFRLLGSLATCVPDKLVMDPYAYFETIDYALRTQEGDEYRTTCLDSIRLLLGHPSRRPVIYMAFAAKIMTQPVSGEDGTVLEELVPSLDLTELSLALTYSLEEHDDTASGNASSTGRLWQLAYLLHFGKLVPSPSLGPAYGDAISGLLAACANEIAERLEQVDHTMHGSHTKESKDPLPTFVRKMVANLPQSPLLPQPSQLSNNRSSQDASAENGSRASSQADCPLTDFDVAKRQANYAVALLRAFPRQAQHIRMSLFRLSIASVKNNQSLPIVQFLWTAASASGVFRKIHQDQRNVSWLLREAAPPSTQFNQPPATKSQTAKWRDEWRIILLFLELYAFSLKVMDDDDFFAQDKANPFGTTTTSSSLFSRKASLPLDDVILMITFLKHLASVLYWNAADFADSDEHDKDVGIAALFGNISLPATKSIEKKPQTLAGNGVSHNYMKGLVTGLLRSKWSRFEKLPFQSRASDALLPDIDML
jgi:ubiquitin-protein ligase E3 C